MARRADCGIATCRTSSVAAVGNAGYRKKRIVRDAVGAIPILPAPGNAGRNHLLQLFFNYKERKKHESLFVKFQCSIKATRYDDG